VEFWEALQKASLKIQAADIKVSSRQIFTKCTMKSTSEILIMANFLRLTFMTF